MSKRPGIKSRHEKGVERSIQKDRRQRLRSVRESGRGVRREKLEPYILSYSRGPVDRKVPAGTEEWIRAESADQDKRYQRIAREVAKLAPLRDGWVKEFLLRISGPRGYSVHAGTRRTIPRKELPKRPRRPWRLLW